MCVSSKKMYPTLTPPPPVPWLLLSLNKHLFPDNVELFMETLLLLLQSCISTKSPAPHKAVLFAKSQLAILREMFVADPLKNTDNPPPRPNAMLFDFCGMN